MSDIDQIPPHGGTLVNLLVTGAEAEGLRAEAANLPKLAVSDRELADLEMLAVGALSPLTGFQGEADYHSILDTMHLKDGLPWSIPVTLSVDDDGAHRLGGAAAVALTAGEGGEALGVLRVSEIYPRDKAKEAISVYRTDDPEHPGVAAVNAAGDKCVAGELQVIALPPHDDFLQYRLTPAQTRAAFAERGWRTVVGFQTRNPIHRAHEYIQKCALEIVDGLLVHPLVGATKGDDVPADVRMRCYEALFEGYYPKDRAMVSVFPAAMRYAGPREAIWHAICRKNYGCTHFIVGRDHAGVGSYYGTYDAQDIFKEFAPGELGIQTLNFEHSFWCNRCEGMASPKTCPHGEEDRVSLSGTKVRDMLRAGERPPQEFSPTRGRRHPDRGDERAGRLADQLLRQQPHHVRVDGAAAHELRPPARALHDEPHLLVGASGARVRLEDVELDPLEVHMVETEPTERADGVRAQALVPVGLAQPDAQQGGARRRLDGEERTPPDRHAAVDPLDDEARLRRVLPDHVEERLIARHRLRHDQSEALPDLGIADQIVQRRDVGRLVRSQPDQRPLQGGSVLFHGPGAYRPRSGRVELLTGALVASAEPSAYRSGRRTRRQTS